MWSGTPSPIFWPLPRRCPVDDAPHTTCTSPDYHGTPNPTTGIVIRQLPMRDEQLAASRPVISAPPPDGVVTLQPSEFTTATYRRKRRA
jgi:hypothetical protein